MGTSITELNESTWVHLVGKQTRKERTNMHTVLYSKVTLRIRHHSRDWAILQVLGSCSKATFHFFFSFSLWFCLSTNLVLPPASHSCVDSNQGMFTNFFFFLVQLFQITCMGFSRSNIRGYRFSTKYYKTFILQTKKQAAASMHRITSVNQVQ